MVASVTGISGLSIASSAIAQNGIGYVVENFSYKPVFTVAGFLHPLAAIVLLIMQAHRADKVEGRLRKSGEWERGRLAQRLD